MRPKRFVHPSAELESQLEQSRATGILDWQELAHLDFQYLIELAQSRTRMGEESESQ